MPRAHGRLTTGCSGLSAARPAAEPELRRREKRVAHLSLGHETKWYEYALRFLFGGATTVVTGVPASRYGPVFGGLFLAFPAIFPASATLVEKHEREKKQRAGIAKTIRGREVAARARAERPSGASDSLVWHLQHGG